MRNDMSGIRDFSYTELKKINFTIREMEESDLQKGFFEALSDLTVVGEIANDTQRAGRILKGIKANPLHKIFVAVKDDGEVIGTMTIFIEQKFIHDGGLVAHIEDLVTKKGYEHLGIGRAVVNKCTKFAKINNCYKVICTTAERNLPFWERVGYRKHEVGIRCDPK